MPGGGGGVVGGARVVVRLIEVIKGRDLDEGFGRQGVDPVGNDEGVALALAVAQAVGAVVVGGLFPVSGIGIVGNLEVVLAVLAVETELIFGGLIANDGSEDALRVGGVVEDAGDGGGEAVVGA